MTPTVSTFPRPTRPQPKAETSWTTRAARLLMTKTTVHTPTVTSATTSTVWRQRCASCRPTTTSVSTVRSSPGATSAAPSRSPLGRPGWRDAQCRASGQTSRVSCGAWRTWELPWLLRLASSRAIYHDSALWSYYVDYLIQRRIQDFRGIRLCYRPKYWNIVHPNCQLCTTRNVFASFLILGPE